MSLIRIGKGPRKPIAVDKEVDDQGLSPMAPPDPFSPPGKGVSIPYDEMHPVLQELRDEHKSYMSELDAFERVLSRLQARGPDHEANQALGRFFEFLETVVLPHNRREEKTLFPLLEKRLLESGEHSSSPEPTTGVEILVADHLHMIQLAAVILNFFGLAAHLPDERSQRIVIEQGIEQGKALVEILRLHIYREDEVIFSLAHNLITTEELDQMARKPE